jgi:hypothetical protein
MPAGSTAQLELLAELEMARMPVAFTMPRSPPVSPTPAIHPMPGEISIEVLTKCRVQYLSYGDVRFVDARRY